VSVPCRAQYLAAVACAGMHRLQCAGAAGAALLGCKLQADSNADAAPQDQHIAVADIHRSCHYKQPLRVVGGSLRSTGEQAARGGGMCGVGGWEGVGQRRG